MIDIKKLVANADEMIKQLNTRGGDFSNLKDLTGLDKKRKELINVTESSKAEQNTLSKEIGKIMGSKGDASKEKAKVSELKKSVEKSNSELNEINLKIKKILMETPNVPRGTVPVGTTEDDNVEIKIEGKPTTFDFKHKPHWDLMKDLDIVDAERAAKMTGSRFVIYKGLGARLERALISFALDKQTEKGYLEILPPVIVNENALLGVGQLPKFEEDLFKVDGDTKYLIPTAEVPLTYFHANEVLDKASLPISYTAYTSCFRSEAGSAGRDVKGVIRLHQFNKVELFKLTTAEQADKELEKLLVDSENILKALEIPYRVIEICTGDLGFSSEKTYDIEVWLPSYGEYKEASSCSVFGDYQTRRSNIRYKDGKETKYPYSINGSGLATPRVFAAILENFQNEDGTVNIPKVLQPYMNNMKIIK